MTEKREEELEREKAPSPSEDAADLEKADPSASEMFFGKHLEELVSGGLETKDAARTPLDSPSVQFFGGHLEDYINRAPDPTREVEEPAEEDLGSEDDAEREPTSEEQVSIEFFGEPLGDEDEES
jgi:hypothetical protein